MFEFVGVCMYPLKFQPIFQKRVWGGQRLSKVLGKSIPPELTGQAIGESWELADLQAGVVQTDSAGAAADGSLSSVIINGPWKGKTLHSALGQHARGILGNAPLAAGGTFPLLVKFLDAQADLSVQVHPDAAYVQRHPDAHVKNEAWFIFHAEPGAKIYKGVKPGVDATTFRNSLETGQVEQLLNAFNVKTGDCYYLPSGTVHALGAGILAAEVQTPSDTTFRVYDWNRLGPDGKSRNLHVEKAMEVIQFSQPAKDSAGVRSHVAGLFTTVSRLVTCENFTLERVRMIEGFEQEIPYKEPVVWIVIDGQGVILTDDSIPTAFTRGDTLLLPANMRNAKIRTVTNCSWLEARLPGGAAEVQ